MNCSFCGEPVDPDARGVFAEIKGWAVNRRQGGANQISLRANTGRYAHAHCVRLARNSAVLKDQEAMF